MVLPDSLDVYTAAPLFCAGGKCEPEFPKQFAGY